MTDQTSILDVKEAAKIAVRYTNDLLAEDQLVDLRLEEVELSDSVDHWYVTVGFSRPEMQKSTQPVIAALNALRPQTLEREYRIVKIDARTGEVRSMKIRRP